MAPQSSKIKLDILNTQQKKVGDFDLTPYLFAKLEDHGEVYFAMKALASHSKGKHGYTKGRSEISGSTKKMYRQKGTGNARHSTDKAPQFVGGGISHGPKGKDRGSKVNKRVWRKAMQLLLIQRVKDKKVWVYDQIDFKKPKTKEAKNLFSNALKSKTVVVDQNNKNLDCSVRNLKAAKYKEPKFITIEDLAYQGAVVFSKEALETFMKRIQHTISRGDRTQ